MLYYLPLPAKDETRMIELWRELDMPFDSETLSFLPRSPILLKMGAKEAESLNE